MTDGEKEEKLGPEALKRLNEAVREAGGPAEISRASGEALRTVNLYLAGQADPKLSKINRIIQACNKSLGWLLTGRESPDDAISVIQDDFAVIHRYGSSTTSKEVSGASQADAFAFRHDWLQRLGVSPENATLITAAGDSMEPTISDGDPLLVDRSIKEFLNGRIFAISVDGELLVKRIQVKVDGSIIVMSDNPRYAPEEISRGDLGNLHIIGQIKWGGRAL